uniref:Uncharacterized protein n=1 Tax=Arundo donax TaxID=35708 RepID=A0A0A8YHW7_ARUDO
MAPNPPNISYCAPNHFLSTLNYHSLSRIDFSSCQLLSSVYTAKNPRISPRNKAKSHGSPENRR